MVVCLHSFAQMDSMTLLFLYIIPPSLEIESKQAEFNLGQEIINKTMTLSNASHSLEHSIQG